MSADLVLSDAAIDSGLGVHDPHALALWAQSIGGDLGALGAMVLAGSAAPFPPIRVGIEGSNVLSKLRNWTGGWSIARSGRQVMLSAGSSASCWSMTDRGPFSVAVASPSTGGAWRHLTGGAHTASCCWGGAGSRARSRRDA